MVVELKYGNTNTYLIRGDGKYILFDTDWAGTFESFCKALKEKGVNVRDVEYLFISHFHPDHMGIAQQIADLGIRIVICDVQQKYIHSSDDVFYKDTRKKFVPIDETKAIILMISDSRSFLKSVGIAGEIIYTPGHSDDSISLILDEGSMLVGDLNPLYELPLHEGTQIGNTWAELLTKNPSTIYYGHAKTAVLSEHTEDTIVHTRDEEERYTLVSKIMKYIDKGYGIDKIQKKTHANIEFIEDVTRMYLTHQNVGVQGILDRIEIKNR